MSFGRKIVYVGGAVLDLAKFIIIVVIALVLLYYFVGTIFVVSGESMEPTLKDRELVWSNKFIYLRGKPERGDAVVVLYPGDPARKKYVKRVVGLPGETLRVKDGRVWINDFPEPLAEPYIPPKIRTDYNGIWIMKDDEYFLMGDNRENSNDSRFFGPVERRFIFGKVTEILWPRLQGIN